jgi:nicotinamide mononucleotide transporter
MDGEIMTELAHVLAPLNTVLFTLGNDRVSVAELLGFVTGAACVWLTVAARISNFPVGIANSAFFLVLFLSARLYADSGLQVVYIILGFIGWRQWLHGSADRGRLVVASSGCYPPHLGHLYLITEAAIACDRVTVRCAPLSRAMPGVKGAVLRSSCAVSPATRRMTTAMPPCGPPRSP